jgi:hypothetical protein
LVGPGFGSAAPGIDKGVKTLLPRSYAGPFTYWYTAVADGPTSLRLT